MLIVLKCNLFIGCMYMLLVYVCVELLPNFYLSWTFVWLQNFVRLLTYINSLFLLYLSFVLISIKFIRNEKQNISHLAHKTDKESTLLYRGRNKKMRSYIWFYGYVFVVVRFWLSRRISSITFWFLFEMNFKQMSFLLMLMEKLYLNKFCTFFCTLTKKFWIKHKWEKYLKRWY